MKKLIIAAIAATITSTAASAAPCSFFTKLAYGGHCTEAEWLKDRVATAKERGETFTIIGKHTATITNSGTIIVPLEDVKKAYAKGGKDAVIDLIGKEAAEMSAKDFDEAAAKAESLALDIEALENETGGLATVLENGDVLLEVEDAISHAGKNNLGHTINQGDGKGPAPGTVPPAGMEVEDHSPTAN